MANGSHRGGETATGHLLRRSVISELKCRWHLADWHQLVGTCGVRDYVRLCERPLPGIPPTVYIFADIFSVWENPLGTLTSAPKVEHFDAPVKLQWTNKKSKVWPFFHVSRLRPYQSKISHKQQLDGINPERKDPPELVAKE